MSGSGAPDEASVQDDGRELRLVKPTQFDGPLNGHVGKGRAADSKQDSLDHGKPPNGCRRASLARREKAKSP